MDKNSKELPFQRITASEFSKILDVPAKPVPVFDVDEFASDPGRFFAALRGKVGIVKGVFADLHHSVSWDEVSNAFAGASLRTYQGASVMGEHVSIDATDYFKALTTNQPINHNVVDHPVAGTILAQFSKPAFLGDNWFHNNFFLRDSQNIRGLSHDLNMTATGGGNYTTLHEDGDGMFAWMYLVLGGTKHWEVLSPVDGVHLWKPCEQRFYDPFCDEPDSVAFDKIAQKYVGAMEPGDFIFVPPAWIHHVFSQGACVGVGGNMVNSHLVSASVDGILEEIRRGSQLVLDIEKVIDAIPRERIPSELSDTVQAEVARLRAGLRLLAY